MRSLLAILLLGTLSGLLIAASAPAGAPLQAPFQAKFPGRDPILQWDAAGNLHAVYVEERNGEASLWYRRLGASPAGPVRVSPPGTKVIVQGNEPAILAVLPNGILVTAYPVALPGQWKSEIRVQRSTDHGASWSPGVLPYPEKLGSHSFLSAAVTPAGLLALAWLDNSSGKMGLQAATTTDGLTFTPRQTLDPATCQCCGTAMLAGRGGSLWLAYRDLEAGDLRDFQVLRSTSNPPRFDAGAKLSSDGWRINGCPETGARLAEAADGTLWGAWFTAGGKPGIYVTSSKDNGARFDPRTLVTEGPGLARHPEIGVLPGGRLAVLYESLGKDGAHPILARLRDTKTGAWSPARPVTGTSQAIYPRLAVHGEKAALAFTRKAGQGTEVVIMDGAQLR